MTIRRLITLTLMLLILPSCAEPKPIEDAASSLSDAHEKAQGDSTSECVKACTDERRAEAMGWDAIVRECEASCAGK